jgi:hypothetical protein
MHKPGQHVVASERGWSVWRAGATRASRTFVTQEQAIAFARRVARNQRTDLYIHDKTGRIRQRDDYSGEAALSRG